MDLIVASMNTLDGVMIGLVVISMIIGAVRGFVKEALSLSTWVASSAIAAVYFQQVGDTYLSGIQMVMLRYILAGILLSLGTLIAGGILNYLISSLIKKTRFSLPDRMIGTLFGCARGIFLLIVGVLIGISFVKLQTPAWQHSVLIPMMVPSANWLKDRIHMPEKLKEVLGSNPGMAIKGLELPNKDRLAPLPSLDSPHATDSQVDTHDAVEHDAVDSPAVDETHNASTATQPATGR